MGNISDKKVKELQLKANEIRQSIIEMLTEAGSGHTAGPLGMADIFTYLFFYGLKHDPDKPDWSERDRFVLSNGHICPVLYATMAHAEYFPVKELLTLRKFGSRLQGHPHREFLSYVETSSGPLGSGLSQTVGMALANRIDEGQTSTKYFYCSLGDGELDEGQNWEAIMLAGKEKLHNVIAIVDRNNIQIDGYTEDVMPLNPLTDKWNSFNWHVQEIDGHNFEAIDTAIAQAKATFGKPSVIIAHTIPGKGVPEFERLPVWHGKAPNKEESVRALQVLRTLAGKIQSEHE
jgi:transketolase